MLRFASGSPVPAARLLLATALSIQFLGDLTAQTPQDPDKVGMEVRDALTRSGSVRVVLYLDMPRVPAEEHARRMEEVARAQGLTLGLLGLEDFTLSRQFLTLPALAGEITAAGLDRLAHDPGVLRVDLDARATAHLAQSVPLIRADQVQAVGYEGLGVTVAILDTGVDTNHPDLAEDLVGQECFCTGGCCPNGTSRQSGAGAAEDGNGHGTNVSGIVTSKGVVSAVGVAPKSKIFVIKVLDDAGSGVISDTVAALDWIAVNRPDVKLTNMSLGAGLFSGNCDSATSWTLALSNAINNLRNNGTLCFASAGNDGSSSQMGAPACIANAISVGAVYDASIGAVSYGPPSSCTDASTQADKVTCFSDSNSTTDVFAPGAAIRSDFMGGGTATYFGTSQASPHAAGCAADLLSAVPSLTPSAIEAALEMSGVPVTNPRNGMVFPRIDCLGALQSVGGCIDRDHDGYGSPGSSACTHPAEDCDDTRSSTYPGAPQICDGFNNNCSAPGWPTVPANEVDQDSDSTPLCADCNDLNATVYPGAPQLCDGINNNCSAPGWPTVPANELDGDGDGRPICGDCNDANPVIYPGAPQICDGINNDCNSPTWPSLPGTNERDDDADSFSECQGDCDDSAPWTYPGAPQICDGINNNCLASNWPALAGTNEADDDGDALSECLGDCNDANPAVYPGAPQICDGINNNCSFPGWPTLPGTSEWDDDGDGLTDCQGDCEDSHSSVYPGAPQICDGTNNNCLSPGWPALAGTNEGDDDSDTFTECQADCDDANANTYFGAVESNDGQDNQCPTNPGYWIVDEVSGSLVFGNPANPSEISWLAQPAATLYEVVRAGSPSFPPVCGARITPTLSWSDPVIPAPGSAAFYLVRSIAPHTGSWGSGSSGAERIGLCGGESSCSDGTDNDGDALADCDDPDCFADAACAPATFTFVDTTGDDIAPAALSDFFSSITAAPADYIYFSISGPDVTDFSWCAERADFYRNTYLSLAVAGGTVISGPWNRWSLLEGGSWVGPDTTGYPNTYSFDCLEAHAWCAEVGLANRNPAILPEQIDVCEAADLSLACSTGDWVFTLRVGPRRLSTCGF